ncbi:MAG: Gfo/Idh/MocA family oxidoreductase [Chloroflexota bacterium]
MRIIQMGMGGMGNAWLERLIPLPFIEYAGFVEVDEQIAQSQAEAYDFDSAIVFKTLRHALLAVEADAVISIIPPAFRTATLQTCIDANMPLMAEKPLAETLDDAYTQATMATDSGLLYMITQDYRYKPTLYTVKQILDSGELGAVSSVSVTHYRGLQFAGFRAEMPHPLLNDMAVHHFDLLRYFLGAEPETLYGQAWSTTWNQNKGKMSANALMRFPNDVHASYTASWVSNGHVSSYEGDWRFECEKGVLTLIDNVIHVQLRDDIDGGNYTYQPAEIREPITMLYERQSYLAYELQEAIQTGKAPVTRVQDNVKTLQMVFDVIESSETGQVIHKN